MDSPGRGSSLAQVRWLHHCPAAHPADRRPCSGPRDEVIIIDGAGRVFEGCVRHAAATLATVKDVTVQPGTRPGAMADALTQAGQRRPYDFSH